MDEPALAKTLKDERITGAVIDVFEEEPLKPENSFTKLENVTIIEGGSLDASILAGIGIGLFKDTQEGVEPTYKERIVYSSQTEEVETYDRYYNLYRRIYPTFADFYIDLARL